VSEAANRSFWSGALVSVGGVLVLLWGGASLVVGGIGVSRMLVGGDGAAAGAVMLALSVVFGAVPTLLGLLFLVIGLRRRREDEARARRAELYPEDFP